MKKHLLYIIPFIAATLVTGSCTKFQDTLEQKEKESGIVDIIPAGGLPHQAKTEEQITLLAKIGEPVQTLTFYIGEIEMTPQKTESIVDSIEDVFTDTKVGLPMMRYIFTIPKNAKIGPNNVYFVINGKRRPPMALEVVKPDILFPGKVTVYPYATGPNTGGYKVDGAIGVASIAHMENMTYDPANSAFYFSDWYYEDPAQNGSRWYSVIRKMQDSVITTIAGGGKNMDAVTAKDYEIGTITAMCPAPDGNLYFATEDIYYPLRPGGAAFATRVRIMKLNPITGALAHVAGGKIRNGNTYTGFKDGKDSALVTRISSMAFDKKGTLYFIDNMALLRKVSPEGVVSTLFGKYDSLTYETVDYDTGELIYETGYAPVEGHTDGFGSEVLFQYANRIAVAGNGKIYVQEDAKDEWQANIREINIDTREVSTIIGLPAGVRTYLSSGTFKEVELSEFYSFDVDFDGNIIYSSVEPGRNRVKIYKMDLQAETIALLAGNENTCGDEKIPQPGTNSCFTAINRIVFNQFGDLYIANLVSMRKLTIEK
jgi:hypothetical protein